MPPVIKHLSDSVDGLMPLIAHEDDRVWRATGKAAASALLAVMTIHTQTDALRVAESFMAGFEGDEMQEGIDERLATIRAAIASAEASA